MTVRGSHLKIMLLASVALAGCGSDSDGENSASSSENDMTVEIDAAENEAAWSYDMDNQLIGEAEAAEEPTNGEGGYSGGEEGPVIPPPPPR